MSSNVKLELVDYGLLDMSKDIPLALNFNLNDIRNIANRGGAWSKTIKLPGTNNNNDILGNIFNVNVNTLTFDPIIKEKVRIIVDGFTTFEGTFQIRKINKVFKNSEDFKVEYDCYIKSEVSSFYNEISGKYLTDVDLSEYDHTIRAETIIASMASGTTTDGYAYFLAYNDDQYSNYTVRDFRPATYTKVYWDKIFSDVGYTYEWDELYDLKFDKLIIPFNGDAIKSSVDSLVAFRAGHDVTNYYTDLYLPENNGQMVTPIQYYETLLYDNDDSLSQGWYDNDSRYDIGTGQFDLTNLGGVVEFYAKYDADVTLELFGASTSTNIKTGLGGINFGISVKHFLAVRNSFGTVMVLLDIDEDLFEHTFTDSDPAYSSNTENYLGSYSGELNGVIDLDAMVGASTIEVITTIDPILIIDGVFQDWRGFFNADINGNPDGWFDGQITIKVSAQNDDTAHFTNQTDNDVIEGSPIAMNLAIPKKVKQSDFILSIIKMFNLYIVEDEYNPTNMIIKTRDQFYADGGELDWTDKLDITKVDVELMSNKQNKIKQFTYSSDDDDVLNKLYTETTNETFGQLEYIFENEFIKGTDKVEPIFSPTFILSNNGNYVPYINARHPKNNIRILYLGDVLSHYWAYEEFVPVFDQVFHQHQNDYRYAGHFYPNPIEPECDLNYGICDYYAHNYKYLTNNNLFNQHYRTQMDIFENGHIMTGYFNLSYLDVTNLDLNERIYVYDSWWHINKIIDYDLNDKGLTKVELITADKTIGSFFPNNEINTVNNNTSAVNGILNEASNRLINNTYSKDTVKSHAYGKSNTLNKTTSSILLGDKNNIEGKSLLVSGDNNIVRGTNITVLGLNGGYYDENNRTYINPLVKISNYVDAGRDTTLNPYPDNKIVNFISGGRDEVRPLGTHSIETNVDGARDRII